MLNQAVNQVATGRRFAARRIVMNTLGTVPSQVWRKRVIYDNPVDPNQPASVLSFEALQLSKQDEPSFAYDHVGFAYVLMDKFNGGYIHKNNSMNNPTDLSIRAQIELYDDDLLSLRDQIYTMPDEQIQEGDLLGLRVYRDFMLWFEVVGIVGASVMADFGVTYILNRRDELQHDPIIEEVENRP